uniref:Ovule protein n=1 Tax=Mesocestoides corti TaxID=53468 RepID=A0A5K3EVM4_MESCO
MLGLNLPKSHALVSAKGLSQITGSKCDRPICKALYIRVLLHYPYWFILRKNSRIVLRLKEDLRSVYFSYTISRTYF